MPEKNDGHEDFWLEWFDMTETEQAVKVEYIIDEILKQNEIVARHNIAKYLNSFFIDLASVITEMKKASNKDIKEIMKHGKKKF